MPSPDAVNTVPSPGVAFNPNLQGFLRNEDGDRFAEMFRSFTVSGGTHSTTVGTLTATPAAFIGYAGGYRVTETGSITYAPNATTYVIFTKTTTEAVSGYTRVSGTHYMTDASGAQDTVPANAGNLMTVTTNGTQVTAVVDTRLMTAISPNTGLGLSTLAIGDIFYADSTTTVARLADAATGNALISGGAGVAPAYGKVALTTHVSGILPVANGGSGLSTAPSNGFLLIGNGSTYTLAALTAGTGVGIANGAGTITISTTAQATVGTWYVNGNASGTATTTTYALVADSVQLRNTSDQTVVRHAPSNVTVDITAAGPVANGRDQAGAHSANSWIYLYWIWNGTTLASVSSNTAPPTGPTLPATYTHWAFCTTQRLDAAVHFYTTIVRNRWVRYGSRNAVLTGGTATVETAVDLSSFVPPNASNVSMQLDQETTAGPNTDDLVRIRWFSGGDWIVVDGQGVNLYSRDEAFEIPNYNQQVYYLTEGSGSTRNIDLYVTGYEVRS